ncbi:ABC transporter substrate-binding protein [uncultured Treponema sp.]|uniref:ABC transporter substrate-binding protein n=1 Tax=uncultured Treponema sp. TaxID=162155 RepID=UPI0025E90A90|nr:ABC transporter substrate-binding protein [uncultured Treponema sp.]
MKRVISIVAGLALVFAFASCNKKAAGTTQASSGEGEFAKLIAAAQAEGALTVYGSCEEEYLSAAVKTFEKKYGIPTKYQRLSTSEVFTKISEENGNPSADVWFGGTTDPYNEAVAKGLLESYDAQNAKNLISTDYKDTTNCWFGIYKGILGFMVDQEELKNRNLAAPKTWDDLLKPEYKGLIMLSNPNTAGTAKLVINTMIQMKGHDAAMEYFKALDKNIAQYTKSGSGPSKMVGPHECVIGVGFLHDGIYQILQGYDNIGLIVPEDGTSFEVGATAIFKGAKHPNAAKLWIEYALSPDCVNQAKDAGSYQFLVLSNAEQPKEAAQFGLDMNNTIKYDFEDAKKNSAKYVEDFFKALESAADDRFKTK